MLSEPNIEETLYAWASRFGLELVTVNPETPFTHPMLSGLTAVAVSKYAPSNTNHRQGLITLYLITASPLKRHQIPANRTMVGRISGWLKFYNVYQYGNGTTSNLVSSPVAEIMGAIYPRVRIQESPLRVDFGGDRFRVNFEYIILSPATDGKDLPFTFGGLPSQHVRILDPSQLDDLELYTRAKFDAFSHVYYAAIQKEIRRRGRRRSKLALSWESPVPKVAHVMGKYIQNSDYSREFTRETGSL